MEEMDNCPQPKGSRPTPAYSRTQPASTFPQASNTSKTRAYGCTRPFCNQAAFDISVSRDKQTSVSRLAVAFRRGMMRGVP
jgi:hypothetical protein